MQGSDPCYATDNQSTNPMSIEREVAAIETGPYRPSDFKAGRAVAHLSISSTLKPIAPAKATRLLGWTPLWLGRSFRNLPLQYTQLQLLTHDPPVPRRTTRGVYFAYGRGADRIQLSESRAREQIYWLEVGGNPKPGTLLLRRATIEGSGPVKRDCQALIHTGGVWVTVEGWNAASRLCVDAARKLVRIAR